MQVKLSQAVKMFFTNSSLEMVYFEAVANALDANATEINIDIKMEIESNLSTLVITIEDNGVGFTEDRYNKFIKLFNVEEDSHKGLGRLVYRFYFNNVKIISHFDKIKSREFFFDEEMTESKENITIVKERRSGTKLILKDYSLQKLGKNNYISVNYIKSRLLEEFYSILFQKKNSKQPITINLELNIGSNNDKQVINENDILNLKEVQLDFGIDLINKLYLHYYIQKLDNNEKSLISAISIDNRTVQYEIIAEENIPIGYKMVFLLFSDYFTGKVDLTRQNINIPKDDEKRIKELFRQKVAELIEKEAPEIIKRRNIIRNNLINQFPHLSSYFQDDEIGYSSKDNVLKNAQKKFFNDQKELLEATELTDEQYNKSLTISSMALTEYVLFRQLTIEQLKKTTKKDSENNLHNLFMNMKTTFEQKNTQEDIYKNKAWILDDKYMTYKTILSDKQMNEIVTYITEDEVEDDADRPDITLIFSNNPLEKAPFDIVIVELKKRGIKLEDNIRAITQLEKRARKLMKHYNNQIQRIWFYGIVEFNNDLEMHLRGEYKELYSSGKMYYRETKVAISMNPDVILPVSIYVWDLDAVIKDADLRNAAFLNMIKSKFITSVE
jgi:hypothetical protein